MRSANEAVAEVRRAADASLAKQGSRWNESCRQAQGVTVKASTVVATATTRVMALEHQIEMLMAESRANSSGRGKTVVEAAVKSLELVRMMAGYVHREGARRGGQHNSRWPVRVFDVHELCSHGLTTA